MHNFVVVAANSHISFRWWELNFIIFHPGGVQLMVVPSNLRISSLSQIRRAGGTIGIQPNSKIFAEL
jgi:hypothetical protein